MLLIRNFCFLFFLSAIFFYSCNEEDKAEIVKSASAFDLKQGEASILQTNQRFMKSIKAADSVSASKCFTTDAKVMGANRQPVIGRERILHFISGMIQSGVEGFKLSTVKIWGDSSILVEEGTYEIFDKKDRRIDTGEYITLWQQETGNWKMYHNIWTSNKPSSAIKIEQMDLPSH
ncbi:MAG: nuclear transport factor 2 family protein [Ginsengibacter sp.]